MGRKAGLANEAQIVFFLYCFWFYTFGFAFFSTQIKSGYCHRHMGIDEVDKM